MPKSAQPMPPDDGQRLNDGCPQAIDLAAWADDRLPERERALLDVHVARCPTCSTLVAEIRLACAEADAGDDVAASLLRSAESLVAPPRKYRFTRWCVGAAAAAAAIAVVWLGYSMGGSFVAKEATVPDTAPNERTLASSDALTFGLLSDSARSNQSDALDVATRSLLLEVAQ